MADTPDPESGPVQPLVAPDDSSQDTTVPTGEFCEADAKPLQQQPMSSNDPTQESQKEGSHSASSSSSSQRTTRAVDVLDRPLSGEAPLTISMHTAANASTRKRIICCCDGTWMKADGYNAPRLWDPKGSPQPWSNITRMSRSFLGRDSEGRHQIVFYQAGVGNSFSSFKSLMSGAIGFDVIENIREVYSFICSNWVDGDEIVLIGFSRGAFTARSVAGLISSIGLLTREGLDMFHPIFTDAKNWHRKNYKDPFPNVPFPNKPRGAEFDQIYARNLSALGLTRLFDSTLGVEVPIPIKAIGVFDTVGSLGIPQVPFLTWLRLRSTRSGQFYDTNLSPRVQHAFQALALDENRMPYSPSIWERLSSNGGATDLRQVWFPGTHSNVGGGKADQGLADVSIAWMMDQLASVGVAFDDGCLDRLYNQTAQAYNNPKRSKLARKWAADAIYTVNRPQRPWGLGEMVKDVSLVVSLLMGWKMRTPGLYQKKDPDTKKWVPLSDTDERVHSSVRVRTACRGLGINDCGVWKNNAMKRNWTLKQVESGEAAGAVWYWEYKGTEEEAPPTKVIPEEPLGPYQRYFLQLSGGNPNVYEWAGEAGEVQEVSRG